MVEGIIFHLVLPRQNRHSIPKRKYYNLQSKYYKYNANVRHALSHILGPESDDIADTRLKAKADGRDSK